MELWTPPVPNIRTCREWFGPLVCSPLEYCENHRAQESPCTAPFPFPFLSRSPCENFFSLFLSYFLWDDDNLLVFPCDGALPVSIWDGHGMLGYYSCHAQILGLHITRYSLYSLLIAIFHLYLYHIINATQTSLLLLQCFNEEFLITSAIYCNCPGQ